MSEQMTVTDIQLEAAIEEARGNNQRALKAEGVNR